MTIQDEKLIGEALAFSSRCLILNIHDVTDAESMVYPGINGNNINWILGHILASRNGLKRKLNISLSNEDLELENKYRRGTNPRLLQHPISIYHLIEKLKKEENELFHGLSNETHIEHKFEFIEQMLHEVYHTGQLSALRWLLGKKGMIK